MASAPVAIAARKRVVAFEAPQQETRALQNARRSAVNALKETKQVIAAPKSWARGSVSIRDQQLYALVLYLLSEEGALKHPRNHVMLVQAIVNRLISSNKQQSAAVGSLQTNDQATWLYRQDPLCSYTIAAAAASCKQDNRNASKGLLVLLAFRPDPVLPLCWTSTRRAVRFVNAVVSLVTANAFISTLGGGHFLCKHLDQAKLMAKIQIAVSVGLQDPILESKCRVNLAYGAMQGGRFRRAYRIIEQEFVVAKQLESDELDKICHAAKVYLVKTYRLHKEYLRNMAELGKSERLFDNFYRQRIVRAAKSSASSHRSSSEGEDYGELPAASPAAGTPALIQSKPHRHSALLRRLSSAISLQELEKDREKKATSPWVSRYQEQAKCDLVNVDITPLMDRFENVTLYQKPQRKPLNVALQEMSTLRSSKASNLARITNSTSSKSSGAHPNGAHQQQQQSPHPILQKQKTLKRQATKLIVKRRGDQQSLDTKTKSSRNGIAEAARDESTTSSSNSRARIIPTRFLYDTTRWKQSARCDYCNFAGGDLECATCDVIAHARCYLNAYGSVQKKTKGAFVAPTRFSWLCFHCQQSLQEEYDERSKRARMQHIAMQRHIFGKVVTAYVRMTKDATVFQAKKKAIIKIQSAFRGRLARLRFDRLQRMCLKPYAVDSIKVRGFNGDGAGANQASTEDLRLSNGFTCNPYVYVSIVDGKDDENQLFCFETSLRKGVSIQEAEVNWSDKLFVPGVDGNITICFTLLSKNGPNNFFLGQAVLRLRDSDVIWRSGITIELPLSEEVEIFPKTTQHQLLRLVEVGGSAQKVQSIGHNTSKQYHQKRDQHSSELFANSNSFSLTLNVHIKPFSDVHSYCGYMGMKNTLDSFQTSSRWCVLADGVLRIYRHFGVTLASDIVDMTRTIEIKLVEASKVTNNGVFHREQNCIAIQHVNRLYLLQCDQKSANKVWLKKLQAATKFGASAVVNQSTSSPHL